MAGRTPTFNILAIVQSGRLAHEALLLAASLRATNPGFAGRLILAEPQPGPLWPGQDPRLPAGPLRDRLAELGADFLPFDSRVFGAAYPHGNKIEALTALPDQPFLFLDTDTLVTVTSARSRSTSPAPPPRCAAKAPGRRSSFTGRLRRHLEGALRPVRAGFRGLARSFAARRILAALPLLQRGLVLPPKPRPLRRAVPGLCARDPRQPPRGAGLPGDLPLARPDRPAAGDPFLRRRAAGPGLAGLDAR